MTTPRRRSAVALMVAGLACLGSSVLPIVTAHADNEPGSGLGSYGLDAFATGIQLRVGEPSFCFTSTASKNGCEGAFPEATSSLQSGPAGSSLASVAWPGDLGANIGSLIVTASNGAAPSQLSMLDSPIRAERRMGQNPDTVTTETPPGTSMKAVAQPTVTAADAHVQSTAIPVGSFGPSSSTAKTDVTGPASAQSVATASVQNIELGVLHIGSVQSTATATTNGSTATVKGKTTVTGATVAGIPVTIDEKGVSVNGAGAAVKPLTDQVNSALSQAGITLLVSEPQGKPSGASVSYTSGALVVVFKPQAGYQFSVTLGQANVTATSVPSFDSGTTGGGTTGGGITTSGSTGGTSGGTSGGGTTAGTGGLSGSPTTGGTVPSTTSGGSVPNPVVDVPGTSNAAASRPLYGGLSPFLPVLGLVGVGLMAFGFKRLPDKVLEAVPPVCPLEENR